MTVGEVDEVDVLFRIPVVTTLVVTALVVTALVEVPVIDVGVVEPKSDDV